MVTIIVYELSHFPFLLNAYCSFFKLTNADDTYIRSFFFKLRNAYCTCISCEAKKMYIIHVFIGVSGVRDYIYLCFE